MFWVGQKLSNLELLAIKSHQKVGHTVNLWAYENFENTPEGVIIKEAESILPKDHVFDYKQGEGKGSLSACSNLFRYRFLYKYGGWYCDTDVIALKPFNFEEPYVFASENNRKYACHPTTCVIKTPVHSKVIEYCCEQAFSVNRHEVEWGTIGPKLLTSAVFKFDLEEYALPPEAFCPVDWFVSELDPTLPQTIDLSCSYAIHLWHEMWRRKGIDKDGVFDPNCMFEKLKNDIL